MPREDIEERTYVGMDAPKASGWSWALHAPVKEVYRPEDTADLDYEKDIGEPGQWPYTRGVYSKGYRKRLWTMRPIMSYAGPEETRKRIEFLAEGGAMTPQIAPDIATRNCVDSDHPLARWGVGMQGMAFPSLREMEELMEGIPLDQRNFNLVFTTGESPL